MRISGFLIHITLVRLCHAKTAEKAGFSHNLDEPASTSSIVKEQFFARPKLAFQLWGELSTVSRHNMASSNRAHFFWTFLSTRTGCRPLSYKSL